MINFPTDVRDTNFVFKANWFSSQNHQAAENQKVHDEYVKYSAQWIAANTKQLQQGLPLLEQPKPVPLQTIYNDDFTISHPPFADLVLPSIDPKDVIPTQNPFGAGSGTGFAGIAPTSATNDSTMTLMMLSHLVQVVDAIAKKVGV